jgi:hypothetical protein
MHDFQLKPGARKLREKDPAPARVAATLDDIATALERIAMALDDRR